MSGRRVNLNMRAPRSSGTGLAVKRCAPTPQPSRVELDQAGTAASRRASGVPGSS
jgi:hypothetical protein